MGHPFCQGNPPQFLNPVVNSQKPLGGPGTAREYSIDGGANFVSGRAIALKGSNQILRFAPELINTKYLYNSYIESKFMIVLHVLHVAHVIHFDYLYVIVVQHGRYKKN